MSQDASIADRVPRHRRARRCCGFVPLGIMGAVLAGSAMGARPAAPSNLGLSFTHVGSGWAYGVWSWQDNSNNEDAFRLQRSFSGPGGGYVDLGTLSSNVTSASGYFDVTIGNHQYFQVRAVSGSDWSDPSNVYDLLVPPITFGAPTGAVATAITDNSVYLSWHDNSTSEEIFLIEYRPASGGDFAELGYVSFNRTNVTITGYFAPETDYEFRVRGARGDPEEYTPYSPVATVHVPFGAPSGLAATATGEKSVQLQWQDNSENESAYAIEARIQGDTDWARLFYVSANATSVLLDAADLPYPGTTYEFRVLAAYQAGAGAPIIDSDPSNVAGATTPFHAPSNLQAAAASDTTVNLTWQDNSGVEEGFQILVREAGDTQWTAWDYAFSNATALAVGDLPSGIDLEFSVRALHAAGSAGDIYSALSPVASAATRDGFLGRDHEPIQWGAPFSYQVETTARVPRTSLTVGPLPGGLGFNPATAVISGTPSETGIFHVTMQAQFEDGWTDNRTLTLRIVRPAAPPAVAAPIADRALPLGGTATVPLADKFSDLDAETAVRMGTSLGDIDIILFPSATPQTVTNFLGYADRGDYEGVAIHRSVPGFVVQGGGYRATAAPDSFTHIPTQPSPPNEPGVSNARATIAMAKRGGDPNSATSEFFFNLSNNNDPDEPTSLDNQNGGFTAFGRVAAPGMTVVDQIAALPTGDYTIDLDGLDASLDDCPMDAPSAPPTIDQSKLVLIESVAPIPTLSHAVTGNSDPSVASAGVSAGQLEISGLEPGETTITVTATDLDGNSVSQEFDVTVTQDFQQWASRAGLPGGSSAPRDDAERDGSCNLNEFAFLTDPMRPDAADGRPVISLKGGGAGQKATITFRLRKYTEGLSYRVESSADLMSWADVWDSGDGLSLPHVQAEDRGDHYLVTVEDPGQPAGGRGYFLRVVASSSSP